MSAIITFKIILFAFLLVALGFFSASETAITSLSSAYLRRLKQNRPKSAKYVTYWESNTYEVLTAIIMGMNIAIVGMGAVAASLAAEISMVYDIKISAANLAMPLISIIAALVLGSIFPKTYGRYNAEKVGIFVLPLIVRFAKASKVAVHFLSAISNKVMRIFPERRESRSVKADEIDFLLSNEYTSPLDKDERELVSNIMEFSERKISQVMVSRQEIFAINIEDKKEDLVKKIIENKYSRVPVYKGNLSNVVGVIYSKDLAVALRNSDFIVLEDLIRPAYYIPESAKVSKVLKEFKSGHQHIAIVVDEFGLTVGIVSLEDLLEEIVGEMFDEYDVHEKSITPYGDNAYLVRAQESVINLNKEIDIFIPEEENYSTVNGWLLEISGKIPARGEKITWNNFEIEIHDGDGKKVKEVIIRKPVAKN